MPPRIAFAKMMVAMQRDDKAEIARIMRRDLGATSTTLDDELCYMVGARQYSLGAEMFDS